jgi:hypothetical protein
MANRNPNSLKGGLESIPGTISQTCLTTSQADDVRNDAPHLPGSQEVLSSDNLTLQAILAKMTSLEQSIADRDRQLLEKDKRLASEQQARTKLIREIPYRSLTVGGRNGDIPPSENMFDTRIDPDGTTWVRPPWIPVGPKFQVRFRPATDAASNPIMHPDATKENPEAVSGVHPKYLQLCYVDKTIGELRINTSLDSVILPNPLTGEPISYSLRGWYSIGVAHPRTYVDIRTLRKDGKPNPRPHYITLSEDDVSPEAIAERVAKMDLLASRNSVSAEGDTQSLTTDLNTVNDDSRLDSSPTPSEKLENAKSPAAQEALARQQRQSAKPR